jgi:predicted deacetylase
METFKVNISIDDVSPHPMSSAKVIDRCMEVIEEFPDVKFTLFIPAAYWRTIRPEVATTKPLNLSDFPDFCDFIRRLPKNNFEVGYHGFYHGIPGKSDNDELAYLSYEEAVQVFKAMVIEVNKAGLVSSFKPIIRPPAWRMSPECMRAAREMGFGVLALSPDDYVLKVYEGAQDLRDDVVYYNVNPPFKPLELFKKTEMVYHACEWDRNYLSKEMTDDLVQFLKSRTENIDFCFIGDLLDG